MGLLPQRRNRPHRSGFADSFVARASVDINSLLCHREAVLKNTRRSAVHKEEHLLTGVARTIGSTLGTIVAKVNSATASAHPAKRRRTAKKKIGASRSPRRKRSRQR